MPALERGMKVLSVDPSGREGAITQGVLSRADSEAIEPRKLRAPPIAEEGDVNAFSNRESSRQKREPTSSLLLVELSANMN